MKTLLKLLIVQSLFIGALQSVATAQEPTDYNLADDLYAYMNSSREPATAGKDTPYRSEFEIHARQAAAYAHEGNHSAATQKLFNLTIDPRFASMRNQAKYLFGLALAEMKLNQAAAFQFIEVVRAGDARYQTKAIEKLAVVADRLNNESLLTFAISKVKIGDFPPSLKDMIYFRLAQAKLKAGDFKEAIRGFENVRSTSTHFVKARYLAAQAVAQSKNPERSAEMFAELENYLGSLPPNNTNKVAATLGRARALYQAKKFDEALAIYRRIPKDNVLWHDALFESSWAMLQGARFRSVLGNMQSLHSNFYDDFFLPEALMLRSIVYLYICQFDEMTKTLDAFENIYQPMQQKLVSFLRLNTDPRAVYREMEKVMLNYDSYIAGDKSRRELNLPFPMTAKVLRNGDFEQLTAYLIKLHRELQVINQSGDWQYTPVGRYVSKIVKLRISNGEKNAGQIARTLLLRMQNHLRDQFEQLNYARYELIAAQKSGLEKKISGRDLEARKLDDEYSRSFYTRNGYEYWPLKRQEYWLDEIGNIYYLGVRGCE